MQKTNLPLIEDIRKVVAGYKSGDLTFAKLSKDINITTELLTQEFRSEAGLVEEILDYEQSKLEELFLGLDFTDENAIDSLLRVSKEINKNFNKVLPCITFDLRIDFPDARKQFVEKRIQFVTERIKSNFDEGMQQGMYRPDLSAELISRLYISRLLDIHNPAFFPNETISFSILFDVMFETFILGICTEAGKVYYQKKIKHIKF
jgi:hypothetical protein